MQHDKERGLLHLSDDNRPILGDEPTPIADSQAERLLGLATVAASQYMAEMQHALTLPEGTPGVATMDIAYFREEFQKAERLRMELSEAKDHVDQRTGLVDL